MLLVEDFHTRSHAEEVTAGERFAFGRNWARFLARVNDERIELAMKSLRDFLQRPDFHGLSFLDIGSGSGLFSLAARRLGARVYSFDYDPQSVACTIEMRRRYAPDEDKWTIEQGSVLDTAYLNRLGQFDIVYSWGVLHHTGQMRQALENVKPLVPVGGQLFIAIYNDLGPVTDAWAAVKHRYNALPKPLALLYALKVITREEWRSARGHYSNGALGEWLRTWTEYQTLSTRGMSRWHDWIDWVGGLPYERARIEDVADRFAVDGFRLTRVGDRSSGYGCNEFVFHRDYTAGTVIAAPIPGARSMARRLGLLLYNPTRELPLEVTCRLDALGQANDGCIFFIVQDDRLLGALSRDASGRLFIPNETSFSGVSAVYVVVARRRKLSPPFNNFGGSAWSQSIPDLRAISDPGENGGPRSPAFVFEDSVQLPQPHALHDDIRANGGGRFSHWGNDIVLSASDNSDPNTNGRIYELLIPVVTGTPEEPPKGATNLR
jgi:2-polyprenyl-3-methyl-5-hydroxy-6-metoxy-1,4-benzoquinol methylase